MLDLGKKDILGVSISAVDYEAAVSQIVEAADKRHALGVTALAVHGLMTGVLDREQRYRLNALDLVVPDGQPVRWALGWLHGLKLPDRVYGPTLTLKVCEAAATTGLPIYLYGNREKVLSILAERLRRRFPDLKIAGQQASAFRRLSVDEKSALADAIRRSGAAIVLVGLGCPRQETWVFEHLDELNMPLLAVGAAFDFHAGVLPQAPHWMQARGLEWLFRLTQEPRRLWRRYVFLNSYFLLLIALRKCGVPVSLARSARKPSGELRYG